MSPLLYHLSYAALELIKHRFLRTVKPKSQVLKYLRGYLLGYPSYLTGHRSHFRKRPLGCPQLDNMANLTKIPGANYLRLTGVG